MLIGRTYSASYSLFGSLESEMDRDELANLRHDRDTLQEVRLRLGAEGAHAHQHYNLISCNLVFHQALLQAHADIDTYKLLVSSHRNASGQVPAASGLFCPFTLAVHWCLPCQAICKNAWGGSTKSASAFAGPLPKSDCDCVHWLGLPLPYILGIIAET